MITCPNKNLPEWLELEKVVPDMAYKIWNDNNGYGIDKAPNGEPSVLFNSLLDYYKGDRNLAIVAKSKVYSTAFKLWFGDWLSNDKTNVSKVVDLNGEPLITWHGSNYQFDIFNFNKGGSTTGITEYTYKGDTVKSDSSLAMFFSGSKNVAVSYSFLGQFGNNSKLYNLVQNVLESINYGKTASVKTFWEGIKAIVDKFPETKDVFDKLPKPITTWDQKTRLEFTELYISPIREKVRKWANSMSNGGLSNMYYHILNSKHQLKQARELITLLRNNEFEEYQSKTDGYYHIIFGPEIFKLGDRLEVFIDYNNRFYLDEATDEQINEFFSASEEGIKKLIKEFNEEAASGGYIQNTKLYPSYLNIKNPLSHDYEASSFPDTYKDTKYPTAYIAARQVRKAIQNGHDGVVYANIMDPFDSDNYGILSPNQVKHIDNTGTFSTENDSIYAKKMEDLYEDAADGKRISMLGNSNDQVEYSSTTILNNLIENDYIPQELLDVAKLLLGNDLKVVIAENLGTDVLMLYDGSTKTVTISRWALLHGTKALFARAFMHELVHAHTVGQYETNKQFRAIIDEAFAKAKQRLPNSKRYALTNATEFISEIISNSEFRNELVHADLTLFQKIWKAILSLFGVKYNPKSRLVSGVEAAIIDVIQEQKVIGTSNTYNYEIKPLEDSFGEYDRKLQKTVTELLKGLKSRLETINRYTVRNLDSINSLERIIREIESIEDKLALIRFVNYIHKDIKNAVDFINSDTDKMSATQLWLLRRDYIGFYKPMLMDVSSLLNTTTILQDMENYDDFVGVVDSLVDTFVKMEQKYNNIVDRKTDAEIKNNTIISPTQQEALEELNNPTRDITWASLWLGSIHMVNDEVLRSSAVKVVNAKNEVYRNTLEVGNQLKRQLEKVTKLYGLKALDLMYEKGKNGRYTGYFIRDLRYGEMRNDLLVFTNQLGIKYKLAKDEDGLWILPKGEELKKYNKELEAWKAKYTERRLLPEYYAAKAELSEEANTALSSIQSEINALLERTKDNDGNVHLEDLSRTNRAKYDRLVKQRSNLSNPYNLDGSKKVGIEAKIAEEIRKFNETVGDKVQYKRDEQKFKLIMELNRSKMSKEEFDRWYAANVEMTYTDAFWDRLDRLPNTKGAQTERYQELYQQRKDLLALYKITSSFQIDYALVPENVKQQIKELDQLIADELELVDLSDMEGDRFGDFAKIEINQDYYAAKKDAKARGKEYFDKWFEENHYYDRKGYAKPVSIWTYLTPIDNKYIKYIPNRAWSEIDKESAWYNKNYDENQPDYIQPKKKYYDNSKQYKELKSKPELFKLYEMLVDVMDTSQSKISFLRNTNKYKMPLIENTLMRLLSRGLVFETLKWAIKDNVAIKNDDVDYVETFGRTPSGQALKHVPTHFLKMLEDPNKITADIVGAVISFYLMADNYKSMTELAPVFELLADRLSRISYDTGRQVKSGIETNRYKKLILFMDMNIYGKRRDNLTVDFLGKKVNVSKLATNFAETVRRTNLFNNFAAIATNLVTAEGANRMESMLGRYYSAGALVKADRLLALDLMEIMPNIGNPHYTNKLLMLLDYNQVTSSNEEIFKDLDRNSVSRTINKNFWYGGYSIGDFTVKSRMLLAMYYSTKLYNGEFINKELFLNKYFKQDKRRGLKVWDELSTTLYDVYEVKKGKLVVQDKYKQYVTESLINRVKNTANTLAARLDGVLNDTDRAAIHAHAIGQLLVIHRNFMIGGILSRIAKKHFNYMTGLMEEGAYRTFAKFILHGVADSRKLGIIRSFMSNYLNMEDFEKYNVRKVVIEQLNIIAFTVIASMLIALANDLSDGDDDFDDWALYLVAYIAARARFEFRTLYNPLEFLQLIKSPSAGVNLIDTGGNMLKLLWIPGWFDLEHGPLSPVNRGPYEGFPKVGRNIIKMTPLKNLFESTDPQNKLNYLENNLAW